MTARHGASPGHICAHREQKSVGRCSCGGSQFRHPQRGWETWGVAVMVAPAQLPALVRTCGRSFGVYVHVPFCATRCGYCDFNTYTPGELGAATPDGWLAAVRAELGLAAERLGPDAAADT